MIDDSAGIAVGEGFGRVWKAVANGSYRQLTALKNYYFDLGVTGKWHLKAIGNDGFKLVFGSIDVRCG